MTIRLKYGNTNTFFIRGSGGNLLIDTDYAGTMPGFYKEIKKHRIQLNDITYVFATHYHPDHIGLVSELMKKGVKLLVFDTQTQYIHFSDGIFDRDKYLRYEPINAENAISLQCEEGRAFFERIGINGEIIPTTSHSPDSISFLMDDGDCFVGDLEPIEHLDAYEDNIKLKEDWDRIIRYHPKRIYYAHANEKVF